MLRHHLYVQAPLTAVLRAVDRADFASTTTDDETLHVVSLADGVGAARREGQQTMIDIFDEDDGADVARLVDYLRKGGFVVDRKTSS